MISIHPNQEGSKLHLKATEEFPEKKLHVSISNGPKINEVLDECRSMNACGMILSKVLDNDDVEKNILKNCRSLSIDDVQAQNNPYLGNDASEAPPDNKMLLDLNPGTDENHKRMFYKRVRSQMMSQHLFCSLDRASINKLISVKKKFTWKDSNVGNFYDGASMSFLM